MRIMLAIPLLLLGACQVSKDDKNDSVTVSYNEDVAANTADQASNEISNIAADVGNEIKDTGDKIENRVGDTDVSVNVNRDVKTENKSR
jgi:hypothetical protein